MAVNWPGAVNVIRDCSGRGGGCLTPAGCEVDRSGKVDGEASVEGQRAIDRHDSQHAAGCTKLQNLCGTSCRWAVQPESEA